MAGKILDYVTIMAGGGGTRLWPASTESSPKPFMKINAQTSLFFQSIERALILNPKKIIVICNKNHIVSIIKDCKELDQQAKSKLLIVCEPAARNTATALMFVSKLIEALEAGTDSSQLVLSADHLIHPLESFKHCVETAMTLVSERIVVFGIPAKEASTAYGYVQKSAALGPGFTVKSFIEKPDIKRAQEYSKSSEYFWNSGIFLYRTNAYLEEIELNAPDIKQAFTHWHYSKDLIIENEGIQILRANAAIEQIYEQSISISVDYAVMEPCKRIAMMPTDFSWSDVGSWDSIAKIEQSQTEAVANISSAGNYVRSSIPVAICGIDDLIVVEENGALLICKKGQSELVREAKRKLAKN